MGFKAAVSKQRYFRVAMYGMQGSGKTLTGLLWGEQLAEMEKGRMAVWDTEHGTDFYTKQVKGRTVHPKPFDFDADYGRSFTDAKKGILALDPKVHRMVIVDSTTELWNSLVQSYDSKKTSAGTLPIWAWGQIKPTWRSFLDQLLNLEMHVFILGREGKEYGADEDDDGKEKILGAKFKAEAETGYEMQQLVRMRPVRNQGKRKGQIQAFFEKDRASVLHQRTIFMPNFKNSLGLIVPFLDLKSVHARRETSEEAARKDTGVIAAAEQEREDKSRQLMAEVSLEISRVTTRSDLKKLKDGKIARIKDQLTPADTDGLSRIYTQRYHGLDAQKRSSRERDVLITSIDRSRDGWSDPDWDSFRETHVHHVGEWPAKYSLVELRVLARALDDLEPPAETPQVGETIDVETDPAQGSLTPQ